MVKPVFLIFLPHLLATILSTVTAPAILALILAPPWKTAEFFDFNSMYLLIASIMGLIYFFIGGIVLFLVQKFVKMPRYRWFCIPTIGATVGVIFYLLLADLAQIEWRGLVVFSLIGFFAACLFYSYYLWLNRLLSFSK